MRLKNTVFITLLALAGITGCSVSTLRCSVSDNDSFVELINAPQDISGQSRHYRDLCGFAYDQERRDETP